MGFFLQIEQKDIGDLLKIRIGHDGKGFGAGWHLDKVKKIHIYEISWVWVSVMISCLVPCNF